MALPGVFKKSNLAAIPVRARRAGLGGAVATAGSGSGGAPPPPARALGFVIQAQTQTEWCWSAVAVSVSTFFAPASGWTQCTLAGQALGRSDCCGKVAGNACNLAWYLDRALGLTGNLDRWVNHALSAQAVQQEINAGAPVCCRIIWGKGPFAHFVVIEGYSWLANSLVVSIKDPFNARSSTSPLASFTTAYRGNGRWVETCETKP